MLQLLWALINVSLFLFFLFICFKATKFIRDNLGLLASLVFVFGLLSFMGNSDLGENGLGANKNESKKWTFTDINDTGNSRKAFKIALLDKNLLSKYQIGIIYITDTASKNKVPLSATSITSGIISGLHWHPDIISTSTIGDGKSHEFTVIGNIVWKLLGITVYTQSKSYKITVVLD